MKKCQCDENPWTFDEEQNQWQRGNRAWLPKKPKSACDCDIMYCDRCGDMMFHHGMVVPTASRWEYNEAAERIQVQEKVIKLLALRLTTNAIERDSIIQTAYDNALKAKRAAGDTSPVPLADPESTCGGKKEENWLKRLVTRRNYQSKG